MLLPILADEANADRRRANFRALLEVLSDLVPEGWSRAPRRLFAARLPGTGDGSAGLLGT